MPVAISNKRYAQAVFEIARERNELKEWLLILKKVAELMDDPEVAALLETPRLSFDLKAKLVKEKLGEINPIALNFAYLLVAKRKFKSANQIANEYERLLNDYHGIKLAEVITPIPLNDTDREKLIHNLETIVGKKIAIDLHVDPTILGGIIARIDDMLIDGSIRNKLNMLKNNLVDTKR